MLLPAAACLVFFQNGSISHGNVKVVVQCEQLLQPQKPLIVLVSNMSWTHAEFVSAPNLTAAAVAQNLTWAPVSLTSVTVESYTLAMDTSGSASLTLSVSADLGVSGDIADVVANISSSQRRSLLQNSASMS